LRLIDRIVVAACLVATGCAPVFSRQLTTTLPGHCQAHLVSGPGQVSDVFLWMGGTGNGSIAFVPEEMRKLLRTRPVGFVTFDKPGMQARFGHPGSLHIDDEVFRHHTQAAMLLCAEEALGWSRQIFGSVRVHLRGHSEGSLIALDLYDEWLSRKPAEAAAIQTLILSGVPLEPFAEIVRRQVSSQPLLARAIERCDWPVMKRTMGLSCEYLREASARPSGRAMFERLAAKSATAKIRVLTGVADFHTPSSFVQQLELWNGAEGHLDLTVRYYQGAHGGTPEARRMLADLLERLVVGH
jgi:pimeloyl-ACP methyl ester carboxylesterase